ncbi:phosphotransferase [Streptomyces sp. NPDC002795]|uniref:phosphotransferase n=1 Tax=Streptomyces sp. NPDC002795 TaxID=3364665 RepID=UPI003687BCF3
MPREAVKVVPRIWSEAQVLDVVAEHLDGVPRFLRRRGSGSVHEFVEGWALNSLPELAVLPGEKEMMVKFAHFFADLGDVPADALPARPTGWPADGDSDGFLDWLVDFVDTDVRAGPHQELFGPLFDALLVPDTAMKDFKGQRERLARRPFRLLHTDVHQANVVLTEDGEISVIDWELALYGDPLHELATHMVRMGYDAAQQSTMADIWASTMTERGQEELVTGYERDLWVYRDFEHAQSIYPDVMRAALDLRDGRIDVDAAGSRVRHALTVAQEPLMLRKLPQDPEIEDALRWWVSDVSDARGLPLPEM